MPSTAAPSFAKRSRSSSMPRSSSPHFSAIARSATTRRCRRDGDRRDRRRALGARARNRRGAVGPLHRNRHRSAHRRPARRAQSALRILRDRRRGARCVGARPAHVAARRCAGARRLAPTCSRFRAPAVRARGRRAVLASPAESELGPRSGRRCSASSRASSARRVWAIYAHTPGVLARVARAEPLRRRGRKSRTSSGTRRGGCGARGRSSASARATSSCSCPRTASSAFARTPIAGIFSRLAEGGLSLLAATLACSMRRSSLAFARASVAAFARRVAVGPRGARRDDRARTASNRRLSRLLSEGRRRVVAASSGSAAARARRRDGERSGRLRPASLPPIWGSRGVAVARRADCTLIAAGERVLRWRDLARRATAAG